MVCVQAVMIVTYDTTYLLRQPPFFGSPLYGNKHVCYTSHLCVQFYVHYMVSDVGPYTVSRMCQDLPTADLRR